MDRRGAPMNEEARRVLPGGGKREGVVPLLEELAKECLKRALHICRRSVAGFLERTAEIRLRSRSVQPAGRSIFVQNHHRSR